MPCAWQTLDHLLVTWSPSSNDKRRSDLTGNSFRGEGAKSSEEKEHETLAIEVHGNFLGDMCSVNLGHFKGMVCVLICFKLKNAYPRNRAKHISFSGHQYRLGGIIFCQIRNWRLRAKCRLSWPSQNLRGVVASDPVFPFDDPLRGIYILLWAKRRTTTNARTLWTLKIALDSVPKASFFTKVTPDCSHYIVKRFDRHALFVK